MCVDVKFFVSAIDNCNLTDDDNDDVKLVSPTNEITFFISSFLNLIKILEGWL